MAAVALVVTDRLRHGATASALGPARERFQDRSCDGAVLLVEALLAEAAQREGAGEPEAALGLYREAIEVDPTDARAFGLASKLLVRERRADEAVSLLAVALEHHPEHRGLRDQMVEALSIR